MLRRRCYYSSLHEEQRPRLENFLLTFRYLELLHHTIFSRSLHVFFRGAEHTGTILGDKAGQIFLETRHRGLPGHDAVQSGPAGRNLDRPLGSVVGTGSCGENSVVGTDGCGGGC